MPEPVKGLKLEISKLIPQESGNFAIFVDGKVLGEISAHPKAAFILKGGKVLEDGKHVIEYEGRRLSVVVRDLKLAMGAPSAVENNKKGTEEILNRVVVTEA